MYKLLLLFFVIAVCSIAAKRSDCYYDFLFYDGKQGTCYSNLDCTTGQNAKCIFSLNLLRRVCCQEEPEAIVPKCPAGYSSSDLQMPLLCDPNISQMGACPDKYKCLKSVSKYTKNVGTELPQNNWMCCKADAV